MLGGIDASNTSKMISHKTEANPIQCDLTDAGVPLCPHLEHHHIQTS